MKIEENYKINFLDRLFQGINEVHIFVRIEYKEFIKWTELNYGNYDIFRQGKRQPRPQGFSLKKWVGPHPFFKGKALGTRLGKRVEYLGYINFGLPVCVDIQWNPDLRTPASYGHLIIADSLLIPGERKLLHFL